MKRNIAIAAVFFTVWCASCENIFINDILPDRNKKTKTETGDIPYAYTVTFDKNHQDATEWTEADPNTMIVTEPATTVDNLPAEPTRPNWNFTGWNTARDGNGTPFTGDTAVTADITVYAQWVEIDLSDFFTINVSLRDNVEGDSVTLSASSGKAGDTVTITYTVAGGYLHNLLAFSGVYPVIASVDEAGNGTRTYIINETDATEHIITIRATFTHTDLELDPIAFTARIVNKTYGEDPFTNALLNSGVGTGTISYSSGTPAVATVDSATGEITIHSAGSSVITAMKASDGIYMSPPADYDLYVARLQLFISDPVVTTTKPYDGNRNAAFTIGTLTNRVGSDDVTVTATAMYSSPNAATVNQITVVYSIGGTDAHNYINPENFIVDGTITKVDGAAVSVPAAIGVTYNSVNVSPVTLTSSTGQTVEYAISGTTTVPASGWQSGTLFTGLNEETDYYVHARARANDNYNAGEAKVSAKITTPAKPVFDPARSTRIDFETDSIGKKYEFTQGDNSPTRVEVTADPANAGQQSLRITTNGSPAWNQAAIIPINLPYELHNYQSFSFRFYLASGTSTETREIMVYAAKSASAFVRYAFGNPASHSNQSQQFAANLVGQTPSISFTETGKWIEYTIPINNPGAAISDLKGNIFIAIGINNNTALDYYVDDLTFTLKADYDPPPIIPLPSTPPAPPSTGAVVSGVYRNMFKEMGKTDAEIDAKVQDTWNKLFTGSETNRIYYPVGSDMAYILDSGNNDVRSEGMSYGMMMALQLNKQTEFDRLWKWARTYMYNPPEIATSNVRGYFSWQCSTTGEKKDRNPAPDGDFYFVTALLFASNRWGDGDGIFEYGKIARRILYDMLHRDPGGLDNYGAASLFRTQDGAGKYMPVFSTEGNASSFTDPSYHLPAFYEVWAIEMERDADNSNTRGIWPSVQALRDDAAFYKQAAATSRAFFKIATNATTGLGPDYANFDGTPTGGEHADFRYDAWRIAMNIAMDYAWFAEDDWQKTFANRIQTFFYGKGVNSYGGLWNLSGTTEIKPEGNSDHSPGVVAGNAVASLAATHTNAWAFLDDFWNIGMTPGRYRYYDGCLYMLGLLHVTGNFQAYLSGSGNYTPNASISPTSATFDRRDDLQADITVTINPNGNTLTGIRNGGTNLTSGTHYTMNGNMVTLKKEYFAGLSDGQVSLTFVFSAGADRTLTVTVKTSPPGGDPSTVVTKYVFCTDTVTATFTPASNAGSTAAVKPDVNGGVLEVNVKGANDLVIIPFNLGSANLTNFTKLKIEIASTSGDTNYKELRVFVPNSGGIFVGMGDTSTRIASQSNALTTANNWNTHTITLSNTSTAYTGVVNLAFGFPSINSSGLVYQIRNVELLP
jgi:uncharacterized repeat protein (TIGR02543 family)